MKQIINYPNYLITLTGKVFSLYTMKWLKPHSVANGYQQVNLFNSKENKHLLIHRLVAEAYLDNKENKRTVNHLNGIKNDNCLLNLEWATYSENQLHSFKNGFSYNSEKQKNAIRETGKRVGRENGIKGGLKKRKLILNELTGIFYNGIQEAADSIGVRRGTLNAMLVGQNKNRTSFKYV